MPRTRPCDGALLAAAALAAATAAPSLARAQGIVFTLPGLGPTSYTFTSTSLATFRTSNFDANGFDDNFLALTERYDSAFAAPPWRLQVRIDGFAPLGLRGDAPQCTPAACPNYLRGDLRLERLALRYQRGILTAELGDWYNVIGRGIAMSFRKVDPLGIDTTVRGGRAEIDVDRLTVRGFGGYVNPQNLDPITLAVNNDWGGYVARGPFDHWDPGAFFLQGSGDLRPGPDLIGGAEAALRLGPDEDVEVGLDAVHLHAPESLTRDFDVDVVGYRVSTPSLLDGALALHGEVHALRRTESVYRTRREMEGGATETVRGALSRESERFGRALYGSAQLTLGNWNALFEWKDYTNYLVSPDGSANEPRRIYSAAPSLEREDVQFRTNSNTRGGRVRVEHAFRPGPWTASFTAVANGFTEETDQDPWSEQGFGALHGYVTIRRRGRPASRTATPTPGAGGTQQGQGAGSASGGGDAGGGAVQSAATGGIAGGGARVASGDWQLTGALGYRHEYLLGARAGREAGAPDWQVAHGDVDVAFGLGADHSIEFRLDGRLERRWSDFLQREGRADYYTFFRGGLSVTWSFMDRLTVSAVGRVDTTNASLGRVQVNPDMTTSEFPVIYPAGEVRYMFIPGSTVRLFGGMTPGGRLCTGGVCRDVPPFQGAIAEVVLRI
jgi:hypothetical protein